jgi:hypothetical protein
MVINKLALAFEQLRCGFGTLWVLTRVVKTLRVDQVLVSKLFEVALVRFGLWRCVPVLCSFVIGRLDLCFGRRAEWNTSQEMKGG